MLRKGMVVAALLVLPTFSTYGYFEEGDKEVTLAGQAANNSDFDAFVAGASGSIGYFMTDNLELSIRQSITYSDVGETTLNGSTRVALDFHFDLEQVQPFVGGNFGYVYGDGVNDTFEAAPELGVKYFVNSTTFIFLMAEYQIFFDSGDAADEAAEDGQFLYTLGIGFRF